MSIGTRAIALQNDTAIQHDAEPLSALVARIHSERDGFRAISEATLRQQIEAAEERASGDGAMDTAAPDEEQDEQEDAAAEQLKALQADRNTIQQQIGHARNQALLAIDVLSLLLSKTSSTAAATVSPALRDAVGLGVLGATTVSDTRTTPAQHAADREAALGVRYQSMRTAADSILTAATRLEAAIESETRYWRDILDVHGKGWTICRVGGGEGQKAVGALGVKYGFSEAAPAFQKRNVAPLRRNLDGSVYLDPDIVDPDKQYLRVRLQREGTTWSKSTVPLLLQSDASIADEVVQARNGIFDEELWQELNREARTLGAYGLQTTTTTLTCPIAPYGNLVLDLVPAASTSTQTSSEDTNGQIADTVRLALRLLLCQAHRQAYHRRCAVPPALSAQKRATPPCNLLRSLLSRLSHENTVMAFHKLLSPLNMALNSASPQVKATYDIVRSSNTTSGDVADVAEQTISALTDRLETLTTFALALGTTIQIASRTAMQPIISTVHFASIQPADTKLKQICPPVPRMEAFHSVAQYILYAVSCALASRFAGEPQQDVENGRDADIDRSGLAGWSVTTQPNILKKYFHGHQRSKRIAFSVTQDAAAGVRIQVRWSWLGPVRTKPGVAQPGEHVRGEGSYEWLGVPGDGHSAPLRTLEEVIAEAGSANGA